MRNKIIYLIYSALALVVLLPLLRPGYIFAMDMVFTPRLSWPEPFNILGASFYFLNFVLPSQAIQKIVIFLVLFLAGIGAHKLVPAKSDWPRYFAGIFYIFNPFVYSRFLFGHLGLLIAYALTPFAVKAIFEFFNNLNLRNTLKLSFWLVLIGSISSHFIVFAFLFFGLALLFKFWGNIRVRGEVFKIVKYSVLVGLIFLVFSGYWILPYFDKSSSSGQYVQEAIGQKDFKAFQTEPDAKYGIFWNVAALYGFWGDRMGQYILPKEVVPHWFLLFLVIFSLAVFGAACAFRKDKFVAATFMAAAGIAFIFSVGVAYRPFGLLVNFLSEKIFIFKGFRDSQKFTALLVLSYAYFGAIGIDSLKSKVKSPQRTSLRGRQKSKLFVTGLLIFFIALPLLYTPLMVWGFNGQLYTSHYPQSWFKANEIFNGDKDDFRVLFFPWHQYMPLSFARNNVFNNPAPRFFDKETIAGDNMEVIGIYTHSERPISKIVEKVVLRRIQGIDDFGEILVPFNIKYVILAKESDWREYDFLDEQKDLKIIKDFNELRIYQNKSWK